MRFIQLFLITGLIVVFGCSSWTIKSDFDPETDFSKFKTYMWYTGKLSGDDKLAANPLVKKRVANSVERALEAKGYTKGTEDALDFVVIIHSGSKERMQVTDYGYGGYGYGGYRRGYGWGGGGYTDVSYYDETTLFIDVVDASDKGMAWRGSATGIVKEYSTQEDMQVAIDDVVDKILAKFPPEK